MPKNEILPWSGPGGWGEVGNMGGVWRLVSLGDDIEVYILVYLIHIN